MGRKYEFTGKTLLLENEGITLRQIIRISDGIVGGWIESEDNLGQEGNCFVCDNARVYGNAVVYDNARVYGNAEVYDNARVYENAIIRQNAIVFGNAEVSECAIVTGRCRVSGNALIAGRSRMRDNCEAYGNAVIYGGVVLERDQILTTHCDHFTFTEFNITVIDNYLTIGCQSHKKEEWPLLLEDLIKEYGVKHPDVYRFFVNYYCKKGEVKND